jgi:hypothetical protein
MELVSSFDHVLARANPMLESELHVRSENFYGLLNCFKSFAMLFQEPANISENDPFK